MAVTSRRFLPQFPGRGWQEASSHFTWRGGFQYVAPRLPGLYAVVEPDRVIYVGSSACLGDRFRDHGFAENAYDEPGGVKTPWGFFPHAKLKYSLSAARFDWLSREAALIDRLRPLHNRRGNRQKGRA